MARQGRAGPALGISAIGSFIGGTLSVAGLMFCSQPLALWAVKFGPVEYTGLMLLGLVAVVFSCPAKRGERSDDVVPGPFPGDDRAGHCHGRPRFTFGVFQLQGGIDFLPMVVGLFGLSEVLINIDTPENRQILSTKIKQIWPSSKDLKISLMPILRATVLGFFLGFVPGGGVITSPFFSTLWKNGSQEIRRGLGKEPSRVWPARKQQTMLPA